jgi:valyl-tRNA synthetase
MLQNIDIEAEKAKLNQELDYFRGFLASVEAKLNNEKFMSSAPEKVIAIEKQKQADALQKMASIEKQIQSFG